MDVATAKAHLDAWLAADTALASNSSFTITFPNGLSRTLTRADGGEISRMITHWHRTWDRIQARNAGAKSSGVVEPEW